MTTVISYSNTTDGYVSSTSTVYSTARAGGTLAADTALTSTRAGQAKSGANYTCYETFSEFAYTPDANQIIVAAHLDYVVNAAQTGTPDRNLEAREFDWGGTITTADWVPGATFAGISNYFTSVLSMQQAKVGTTLRGGAEVLRTRLAAASPLRVVVGSSRFRAGQAPTNDESVVLWSANASGTAQDPCLVYTTVRRSTIAQVGSAHTHLSTGEALYLSSDGAATPTISRTVTTAGQTGTTTSGNGTPATGSFANTPGYQGFEIVRTADDDYFIISRSFDSSGDIIILPYRKTGPNAWTAGTKRTYTMPLYPSRGINQIAASWHKTQGSKGHLMVHTSCFAGTGDAAQIAWATFSCNYLLGVADSAPGTATLSQAAGTDPAWLGLAATTDITAYANETGTGLDSASTGGLSGYAATYDSDGYAHSGIYTLASNGTVASWYPGVKTSLQIAHDADSKLRVLAVGQGRYAVVAGGGVEVRSGTNNQLGYSDLTAQGLASVPSAASFRTSSTWDAVYDPAAGKIWVYYLDAAANRTLRRTGYSLTTYLPTAEETSLSAAVGAVGSTNVSVSAPVSVVNERIVIVRVANVSSGLVLSTVTVTDGFNQAPNAPVLASRANFDATTAAVFTWTFSDPNTIDAQAAYQLQVQNIGTGVTTYDSGTVASAAGTATVPANSLTNGVNYQWRVRTTDSSGAVGAWSAYQPVTTSAGGTVTITDPAADNQAGINTASYFVSWTLTGATQTKVRIVLVDTVTGLTVQDTGFVASTNPQGWVGLNPAMLSLRQYRIEVTTQNASAVSSNTATRLITPNYTYPEVPLLSATPDEDGGRIVVAVSNPLPTGDNPDVLGNYLYRRVSGTLAWTRIALLTPNGSYSDRTVASQETYDYYASGVAPASSTDSVVASATAPFLQGVWVHDPTDPDGTARNYRYGGSVNVQTDSVAVTERRFVGRSYPVYEFGDPQTQQVDVSVVVPFDTDWADSVGALSALPIGRRTYCYRDGRARVVFGTTATVKQTDLDEGTAVGLSVSKVDFSEAV